MAKPGPTAYNPPVTAFLKMHGLGNDFVVFDARDAAVPLTPAQARGVADRRFGIGCDTVVLIGPGSAEADASLRFINADGGEVESYGNATRCVARLLMDERGLSSVRLASRAGLLACRDAGKGLVEVDMGPARLAWNEIPLSEARDTRGFKLPLDGQALAVSAVSMGNPHCILFVPDAEKAPDWRVHRGDSEGPEIGAGWNETGERAGDYVSLRIDDPAFAQPIRAALFQNTGDKSAWSLRWNRQPKLREQD